MNGPLSQVVAYESTSQPYGSWCVLEDTNHCYGSLRTYEKSTLLLDHEDVQGMCWTDLNGKPRKSHLECVGATNVVYSFFCPSHLEILSRGSAPGEEHEPLSMSFCVSRALGCRGSQRAGAPFATSQCLTNQPFCPAPRLSRHSQRDP